MPNDLAIVVLAGGHSRRMGQDKRELLIEGRSLIERTLTLVGALGYPTLLANGTGRPEPEQRSTAEKDTAGGRDLSFVCCPDGEGRGPAAGLLGAVAFRPGNDLVAVACDLPFLSCALIQALIARADQTASDIVLPKTSDGLHPLVAYYSATALKHLRHQVKQGRFGLQWLVRDPMGPQPPDMLRPLAVDCVEARDLGMSEAALRHELFNCNTPNDWQQVQLFLQET